MLVVTFQPYSFVPLHPPLYSELLICLVIRAGRYSLTEIVRCNHINLINLVCTVYKCVSDFWIQFVNFCLLIFIVKYCSIMFTLRLFRNPLNRGCAIFPYQKDSPTTCFVLFYYASYVMIKFHHVIMRLLSAIKSMKKHWGFTFKKEYNASKSSNYQSNSVLYVINSFLAYGFQPTIPKSRPYLRSTEQRFIGGHPRCQKTILRR